MDGSQDSLALVLFANSNLSSPLQSPLPPLSSPKDSETPPGISVIE